MWAPRKRGILCNGSEGLICVLDLLPATALSRSPWTTVPPAKDALKAPHSSQEETSPPRTKGPSSPLFLVRHVGWLCSHPPFVHTPPRSTASPVGSGCPLLRAQLGSSGGRSLPRGHLLIEHC